MLTEFKIVCGFLLFLISGQVDGASLRIIGGVRAVKGEYPWMVSIQFNGMTGLQHLCGGAIINETHIVTAAHCVDFELKDLLFVAGADNITSPESTQQKRVAYSIYMHPQYQNGNVIRHDLAVVQVSSPFVINNWVSPIPLPAERHPATGNCWIAGWGQTLTHIGSDVLLKAKLPIVNVSECEKVYPDLLDPTSQICAGYPEGGVDVCTGDTGGPLMCEDLGHLYIAGIASWGWKCAAPNYPGVYTEVSVYTKSITATLRKIMY